MVICNNMKNITKKTQIILFAGLIAAMILPFAVMDVAHATSYSGPTYDDQESDTTGAISYATGQSTNSQDGKVKMRAFRDSGISYAGQAEMEYRKQITVSAGDTIVIDSWGYTRNAVFNLPGSYAHMAVHPTMTLVSANNVGEIPSGCNLSFTATSTNSNGLLTPLYGTMTCTGLAAGDYYISSYVHARSDNVQNSQTRGTVQGVTLDIDIS